MLPTPAAREAARAWRERRSAGSGTKPWFPGFVPASAVASHSSSGYPLLFQQHRRGRPAADERDEGVAAGAERAAEAEAAAQQRADAAGGGWGRGGGGSALEEEDRTGRAAASGVVEELLRGRGGVEDAAGAQARRGRATPASAAAPFFALRDARLSVNCLSLLGAGLPWARSPKRGRRWLRVGGWGW